MRALLFLGIAAALPPAALAAGGLVGEWHMDTVVSSGNSSTTPDSSGNDDSLTVFGAGLVPGRFGNAFSFDGTQANSLTTDAPILRPAQLTVIAWVKGSSTPGQYKYIVAQGGSSACQVSSYALYTGANGGLQFYIGDSPSDAIGSPAIDPASLWNGQWHAVAGTYDGTTVRTYLDGAEVGSGTATNGAAIDYGLDISTFDVGDYPGCTGFSSTAAVDEVRVYDRALTATEISELQNPNATSPPELASDPTTTSLTCAPGAVAVGQAATCTATVTDAASAPIGAPTGTVALETDIPGTFATGATCTLAPTGAAAAACTVTYTPTAVGSGLDTLTAGYAGDADDDASQGTGQIGVTAGSGGTTTTGTGTTGTTTTPAPTAVTISAAFTTPNSVHAAAPLRLDASATTGATQIIWSVDGHPAASCDARTPQFGLRLAQTSRITLTALGPGGSATVTHTVAVTGRGTVPGSASRFLDVGVCSGGGPSLDITSAGGPPAGCTTTVTVEIVAATGCLTKVTDPSQVPRAETPILQAMLNEYDADAASRGYLGWLCQNIADCTDETTAGSGGRLGLSDRFVIETAGLYVSTQTVRVDGLDISPEPGSAIVFSPAFGRIVSANAVVRAGSTIVHAGPLNLDISDNCTWGCNNAEQPIASFKSDDLPLAGTFPFSGMAQVSFVKKGADLFAEIDGQVTLPDVLSGTTVAGSLRADNTNGITVQSFHAHLGSLGFDGVGLSDVDISFAAPGDWTFLGDLNIGAAAIRLEPPPANGIVFHNGQLVAAGAQLDFEGGGPELFPGLQLDRIGVGFYQHPTAIRGSLSIRAIGIAEISGNFVAAFPSPDEPFYLAPGDLPGAPSDLLNDAFIASPVIGVGGDLSFDIPHVGAISLANGYLLASPGFIAAGAHVNQNFFGLLSFNGGIDGEFNTVNSRFNIEGDINACLVGIICGGATGVISDQGMGVCFGDVGGGFQWANFPKPYLYVGFFGKSCDLERFRDDNVFGSQRAHATAAGSTVTVRLTHGEAPRILRLDGAGGAPNLTVTGPGGTTLAATSAGVHRAQGILALQSEKADETLVGLNSAVPGTYTVTLLPGPALTASAQATELPAASIRGTVSGTGTRRVLHYAVGSRPGQRVTFYEVSHGIPRELGSVSGGHGTLRFTSAPGRAIRQVVASVAIAGVPSVGAQRIAVASFRAPRLVRPGHPGRPRVSWRGTTLTIAWAPATAAARYVVTVRERHGANVRTMSRAPKLRLTGLHPSLPGTVTVTAASADGSKSRTATASYRAAHAAADRFLPFSELTRHLHH